MKLKKVHIKEFQSIIDSNEFEIGDITCLVGKNEAGKTGLLKALYHLNPIISKDGKFDITEDYPRSGVTDYEYEVENEEREHATVIRAIFKLDDEIDDIVTDFGEGVLLGDELILSKGYDNILYFDLHLNEKAAYDRDIEKTDLFEEQKQKLLSAENYEKGLEILQELEENEEIDELKKHFESIVDKSFMDYVYNSYIKLFVPKFLYFDDYYQMTGEENMQALKRRIDNDNLLQSDYPLLGLLNLARLDIDKVLESNRTQDIINKLEGASNHLSRKVLKYWSQNKHLHIEIDVRQGLSDDPVGMRDGLNIWAKIKDTRRSATTKFGTRSKGFVWFFSFLAWYSKVKKENQNVILLLDEPALSLHGKAQEDLLKYFEDELKEHHQLIYTTHSPFMVDSKNFDRVRIVQDKSIESDDDFEWEEMGTKVLTEVLDATDDSLFPLQGALGYEIHQSLFIAPNTIVVEGASDLVYLQTMSSFLKDLGKVGLDEKWIITPVGGSGRIPAFVSLLGSQKNINIVTLMDFQRSDIQLLESLYKGKLIKKNKVITYAEFSLNQFDDPENDSPTIVEADIEDLFSTDFYLELVNGAFSKKLGNNNINIADLHKSIKRNVIKISKYLEQKSQDIGYNHYSPSSFLSRELNQLKDSIPIETINQFEELFKKLNSLLN